MKDAPDGQRIGRYHMVEPIPGGGMGQVFKAWDPDLRREVALKIVREESEDPGRQRRLLEPLVTDGGFQSSRCPQCAETFAALDAIDREYRPKGVQVLAIDVDEHRRNADAFLKGRAYQVRVLFDARLRAFEAFGADGVPATYLIDRRGRIRHAHDDGDDSDAVYRAELDALLAEP
jgi:thiol-disulfide isomerase/thioredoxin